MLVGHYFVMYVYYETYSALRYLYGQGRATLTIFLALAGMVYVAYQIQGPHQTVQIMQKSKKFIKQLTKIYTIKRSSTRRSG